MNPADKGPSIAGNEVVEYILESISGIAYGSITLIVQDGRLIQMDKTEKVRFTDSGYKLRPEGKVTASLRQAMLSAIRELQFGSISLNVKDGKVIQIDRTEKRRYKSLEGVDGEGI